MELNEEKCRSIFNGTFIINELNLNDKNKDALKTYERPNG